LTVGVASTTVDPVPANHYPEIAYGPSVRSRQAAVGAGNRVEDRSEFALEATDIALIRRCDHLVLSTVTESGWPYAQHRGGPAGFVHVPGPTTLAWLEFPGNRQFVSTGNLDHDDRVCLFFLDQPTRSRLKVFGHARIVEPDDDPALIERLRTMGEKTYTGHVERAIVVDVVAADANCAKHITPRWDRAYIDDLTEVYRREIDRLREEG
jgi:predicted pyridoxine 5'-phosphate oxidase superfamily flavin-nucleotide-binding protein